MGGLVWGTFVLVAGAWAQSEASEESEEADQEGFAEGSGAPPAEVSSRVRALAQLSTVFLPGPSSSATTVSTETDTVDVGGFFNPSVRTQLAALVQVPVAKKTDLLASWAVFRDFTVCDTCRNGSSPGLGRREFVSTRDIALSLGRIIRIDDQRSLRVAVQNVVPASRESLSCNPLIASPGAALRFTQTVKKRTQVWATASVARPIHAFASVPVGRCGRKLTDPTVDTLAGPVTPTPWDGQWSAGPNPAWQTSAQLQWFDPHAMIKGLPRWLRTVAAVGVEATRARRQAKGGSVRPFVANVPVRFAVGASATNRIDLQLSVSNRTPTLVADGVGSLAALPSRTSLTLSAIGRF